MDEIKRTAISKLVGLSGFLEGLAWNESVEIDAIEVASAKVDEIIVLLKEE